MAYLTYEVRLTIKILFNLGKTPSEIRNQLLKLNGEKYRIDLIKYWVDRYVKTGNIDIKKKADHFIQISATYILL